jgi:hypothetical protein
MIAWVGFCAGAASGLVMGLWAFDGPVAVPAWVGEYGGTSRRLMRLGHIAFFGIGILNLLLVRELPALRLGQGAKAAAATGMNVANIFLPSILFAAALLPPLKYLLGVPAAGAFIALCIAAWGTRVGAVTRGPQPRLRADPSPSMDVP